MLRGRTVRCCLLLMLLTILPTRPALEVPNVALDGKASQSSIYNDLGKPENAIDGSPSTNYMDGHCTHTKLELNPWWTVDLGAEFRVSSVSITNRGDCCALRIIGAQIRIGNSPGKGGSPR
uniref:pentraxin fusion protein-like n=1 Tax=Podarcis muralis TaxID=64176 RepID=UPI0010A0B77C|nr:pentraxin fusion protein-like [Podarcis muralis]